MIWWLSIAMTEQDADGAGTELVLLDVNALLALTLTTHVHHRAAHSFLSTVQRWATSPTVEAGLCRLLLNPQVCGAEWTFEHIRPVLRGIQRDPRWEYLSETVTLADAMVDTSVLVGHRQVTDIRLVDLAARHDARLATFDRALLQWLAPADRRHILLIPVDS